MRFSYIIATIMAIALFSTIAYADAGDNPGQVIDNPWGDPVTTTITETPTETTPADGFYEVSNYKTSTTPSGYTYPAQQGKVFAGWFTDDTCTTAYTEESGMAYAKFVDAGLLTVKFQEKNDKTALRFLSAIDGIDYSEIGFTFSGTYGEYTIPETTKSVNKVFSTLLAAGYTIEPTVFGEGAQYFSTYTIRNLTPGVAITVDVEPYWITLDGTKVTGPSKHYPVS